MALLELTDVRTSFFTDEGEVRAVDGVSLSLEKGEVLCLVGESGSGKSVTGLSILGLVPDPPGRIVGGSIELGGEDLVTASLERLREIRGDRIAMIFQDPMTSLNPYLRIGQQLAEVLEVHQGLRGATARRKCVEMLERVGMPSPDSRFDDYPHQLSGGMRQRAMIAMALLCQPDLLIADEPTTALDVTIQAQILELIAERKDELGLAVLLITHDLGVVARMADRVAVMYAGRIVEEGAVGAVLGQPMHPYTEALRRSIPRLDQASDLLADENGRLHAIAGMPPSPARLPTGCPFHPRCAHVIDACRERYPEPRRHEGQRADCHVELVQR